MANGSDEPDSPRWVSVPQWWHDRRAATRTRASAPATTIVLAFLGLAMLPSLLEVSVAGLHLGAVLSVHILIVALIWAVAAQAWNILSGYTGQFSFGHAAFFGLGAYTPIVLIREFALSPWLGAVIGGLVATGVGVGIGALSFRYRLRGNYFTLATLAFAELLRYVFINAPGLGAASGYVRPLPETYGTAYGLEALQFRSTGPYYFVILGLLGVVTLVSVGIRRSQFGLHLMTIRENEDTARSIGVPTVRYKLIALAISGFFTALAGAFWAMYFTSIRPNVVFDVLVNIDILLPAIVGGLGTVLGPILGSLALTVASEVARYFVDMPGLENLVYGLFLIGIVLYSPGGLVTWTDRIRQTARAVRRRAIGAEPDATADRHPANRAGDTKCVDDGPETLDDT